MAGEFSTGLVMDLKCWRVRGDMSLVGTRGRLMLRGVTLDSFSCWGGRVWSNVIWSEVISLESGDLGDLVEVGDLTARLDGSELVDGEEPVGLV